MPNHAVTRDHPTIYEVFGPDGVRRIVKRFMYWVGQNDAIWVRYFEGQDIDRIMGHQMRLLGQLWGGPKVYTGRADLAVVHRMIGKDPVTQVRHNVFQEDYHVVSCDILASALREHPPSWVIAETDALLVASMPVVCNLGEHAGTPEENDEAIRRLDRRRG